MENELEKKWRKIGSDEIDFDKRFCRRANFLMNHLCLVVGDNEYKVVDCEVYYHSKDENHCDPYVHGLLYGNKEQLNSSTLFYNYAGGIDITFGNEARNIYGGILVHGIQHVKTPERHFFKLYEIVQELLGKSGNVFSKEGSRICFQELVTPNQERVICTKRQGLKYKTADNNRVPQQKLPIYS